MLKGSFFTLRHESYIINNTTPLLLLNYLILKCIIDTVKFMEVRNIHFVLGDKKKVDYITRAGAYLIPVYNKKIGVIKTEKGYFLIGGGLNKDESHEDCIKRECLEETGYTAIIKEKICSAEAYTTHQKLGYFHHIQDYYIGELKDKVSTPIEKDHILMWFNYDDIKGKMFAEIQNKALEQCIKNEFFL